MTSRSRLLVKPIKQLTNRRHLLLWVGTWTLIMMMSWGAIASLLSPNMGQSVSQDNSQDNQPPTSPIETLSPTEPIQPLARPRTDQNPELAFWSFGIVAIACLYGSIMLTQQIRSFNHRDY